MRKSREVNCDPLSVPRVSCPGGTALARTAASTQPIASVVRVRMSRVQPATSRVQQSTATCR